MNFYKTIYKENDIDISILKYFEKEKNYGINFTISDFTKFISLKKASHFDESFLEDIVFKNRNYLDNINREKNKSIQYNNQNEAYNLDINYKNETKNLSFELNKKSIEIEALNKFDTLDIEKNTLSFEQKKCLIILGLVVKAKLPCILQGETGVGKSHLIKLFAKFLGKELHVIELNKDNDVSILAKRHIFKQYNKTEEKEIEDSVDKLFEKKEDMKNLDLNEKIKKLFEIKLEENKKKY